MNDKPDPPHSLTSEFEPVAPTVESAVSQLISRYGKEAVKTAVLAATKPRRGRRAEKDWPLLAPFIEQDALDWLAGNDPIKLRSNYAVAKKFAERHPGHDQVSTYKRVLPKLAAVKFLMLAGSWSVSKGSHLLHLKALDALANGDNIWTEIRGYVRQDLERYAQKHGAQPPAEMSMSEVRDKSWNALLDIVMPRQAKPGTFGALLGRSNTGPD